ncbi:MAG: protein kinase, partial [Gemmatimonadota bacterium]
MVDLQARLQESLSDRYHLGRELGRGGMAVVYLADDLKHHRQVAIKVLKPELVPALGAERFLREIEIAARLTHPNILPLYDSGEADGLLYYVMPYLEGETLRDRLMREERLPLEEALGIATEVADALEYAHSLGLVHRDIKPENVLFQAGHAVVADFGIARAVSEAGGEHLTESGLAVGTLAYMSPEQASGARDVDGRTDIYSLGCVLYEMLVGEPPLLSAGISPQPSRDGVSLRGSGEAIPAAVGEVLAGALARRPADRFATALELKETLKRSTTGRGTFAASRGVRGLVRHRWLVAASVLALALLLFLPPTRRLLHRLLGGAQSSQTVTLAVLPFENLTGDPGQEYLSDGLTEEMTSQLGRLHPQQLVIIARGSAARYKQTTESIQQIGDELGAQYILEGSVRREADTVRVIGELIRVRDQATVWTDGYQREMAGILALESDVARAVARSLALVLLPQERARLAQTRTVNPQAYEDYLRGREHARAFTPAELGVAQQYFEAALKEDSTYALAYVGLAFVWAGRQQMAILPPAVAAPKARAAANRALALDSTLAEAHYQLAIIRGASDWDWPGAEAEYKKALAINPNLAEAHAFYGHDLMFQGRQDEAMAQMQRAVELDPLDDFIHALYAVVLEAGKRYDDAIAQADSVLRTDPSEGIALTVLASAYAAEALFPEAISAQRTLASATNDSALLTALD